MEESRRKRRELESKILEKVGEVVSAIREAKHVDQVICALHSIAIQLFPVDSSRLAGCVDSGFRNQLFSGGISSPFERNEWWHVFYHGAAFPTLARVLIYNVALDWLACFPLSARTHVFDSFFVKGPPSEVVQAIIPGLLKNGSNKATDLNVVCSNAERILVLYLLDNNGLLQMAREFGVSGSSEEFTKELLKPDMLVFISRIAQLVASIPDKARLEAPAALSSAQFFKQVIIQLLAGAEERSVEICNKGEALDQNVSDGTFLFVGETFSRICRRGFADILLAEVIPRILGHVRGCLSPYVDVIDHNLFKSKTNFQFWFKMIETIKDSYAVERLSEQLLHQLTTEHVTDIEAYWILWILFHRTFRNQASMRVGEVDSQLFLLCLLQVLLVPDISIEVSVALQFCYQRDRSVFVDKCLLWKVFPVCCLRWILQFAVLDFPPSSDSLKKGQNTQGLLDIIPRLVGVWSKRQFVQSAAMEQQAYVTAAVGLSLEQMSKEELETTKDVMPSILQGVSCRLESPDPLVRRMASCIALVFSRVVDPKNPLYLDDSCRGETIDWEFGFNRQPKQIPVSSDLIEKANDEVKSCVSNLNKGVSSVDDARKNNNAKVRHKMLSELKLVDPDEIVDPATLNNECSSDEDKDDDDDDDDDDASEDSENPSDSSLQPYDLSDDDADLKKKVSQLVDLVGALRKPDDPDSVETALDVAEKLVRASPDELQHVSGDLVRALVQVRCSDLTIEGEEDSAEGKRQRALVSLLVTCPFESVATVHKLLYSPNIDISQRILMLDVMTDAAQELANASSNRPRHQQRNLISTSEQPWFLPQSKGPPGAGLWKEVSETGTPLSWSFRYERDLPLKPSQIKTGKSRRWSLRSERMQENRLEFSKNNFPLYAAAFMLPAMQGFDKKRHGVDLLGGDFIVLGKLIYMLGVCMRCVAMHPEAMALAPALLDMLSSRELSHHVEAYVRRSVLFAASCILVALHPSFVASALVEGNAEISKGLEWIRTWALHVAESETDTECSTMAMTCLRLHAEMALQASRVLESTDNMFKAKGSDVSTNLLKGEIKIPYSNMGYQF